MGDLKRHGSLEFEGAVKAENFGFTNSLQCACLLTGSFTQMCLEWRDPFTAGFMGTRSLTSMPLALPASNFQGILFGSKKKQNVFL